MASGTFATVITCIDGRANQPVSNWMTTNLQVDYVDQITEPGPDKALTKGSPELLMALRDKVLISVNAHHSGIVAIAAHDDCAGNPVSAEEHRQQVLQATGVIDGWGLGVRVIGLWVNAHWQVEVVHDSTSATPTVKLPPA